MGFQWRCWGLNLLHAKQALYHWATSPTRYLITSVSILDYKWKPFFRLKLKMIHARTRLNSSKSMLFIINSRFHFRFQPIFYVLIHFNWLNLPWYQACPSVRTPPVSLCRMQQQDRRGKFPQDFWIQSTMPPRPGATPKNTQNRLKVQIVLISATIFFKIAYSEVDPNEL